jgi:hypothetical protein
VAVVGASAPRTRFSSLTGVAKPVGTGGVSGFGLAVQSRSEEQDARELHERDRST